MNEKTNKVHDREINSTDNGKINQEDRVPKEDAANFESATFL